MSLSDYRTLGRSGLLVSPLSLGTMTFGTARWGAAEDQSRAIFDAYVDAGGNVIDTADVYAGGRGEEMVGRFIADRRLRHDLVLSTKAGFGTGQGRLAGGNGAKHIHSALEGSLRRLGVDHVDLYWVHVWDSVTPPDELLQTMAGLLRSGKIRYWGISNAPAWYVASLATLARATNQPGPIAMQYFYSLVSRDVEDEHLPLGAEFSLGMVPWSPLAYGLLTGKYDRAAIEAGAPRAGGVPREAAQAGEARPESDNRLDGANPFGDTLFTERNWTIVDTLKRVADEAGQSPARIALAWVIGRRGVATTLIGASRPQQIVDNASALDIDLSDDHRAALDAVSAPGQRLIYGLFSDAGRRGAVFGGDSVMPWRP
ncbi:aldo/keto reductase [Brevundimonas sp.]|uniref:aldo/keto reductase n=1 Tax=Brevundimonas sp. TaxID=1871086 RepID=UPI001A262F9C|nr:aldo/keto reductase [Brevundimonas sp.]MBJ7483996.1 aldo/keto reductase [Brevundimonas sp.]